MSRLIAPCRHVQRIVRRPWKPGPSGTVLAGVALLSVLGSPLWGQTEISGDRLVTGILDHDSRVKDLDLDYELRTEGPLSDRPRIRARTWRHKGDLRYFLDAPGDDSDVMSWEHSYDGREARTLTRGAVPWPEGNIHREQPTFLTNAASVLHVMGRTSIGASLLDALERGTARVRPEPEQVDGHECWVVEGNTPEEGMPDQPYFDRVYFRYWLDPECGFMPRRMEDYRYDEAETLVFRIIAGDYRLSEVAPGIWLPVAMREEGLELKDGRWQSLGVNHWKVTRVAVNSGLRDEDLKVKFPPGTYVQDFPRPGSDEYEEYRIGADGSIDRGMQDLLRQRKGACRAAPAVTGGYWGGRAARWMVLLRDDTAARHDAPPGTSPAGVAAPPAVALTQPAGLVQAAGSAAVPRIQAPGGIDFGSVVRGELKTRTFVVRPQEGIRVRAVSSSHPALTVRMDPPAEASGQGDMSLAAVLDTSLVGVSGPWRSLLRLDAGDGEPTGLTIEATAEIVEPVVVNPRRLWLGRVACGRESMHTAGVRIHARSTRILGVHGSDPSLVARLPEDQRGNDTELTCRWTPGSAGPYKGKITIETDHPLQPSIELPCYGIAIQEAR